MDLKHAQRKYFDYIRARIYCFIRRWRPPQPLPLKNHLNQPIPQRLYGPWQQGWALDLHSYFTGETWQRSDTGRLVCRYKYGGRIDLANKLADRLVALIEQHPRAIDGIVPVPPSTARLYDPVRLLGQVLARRLGLPLRADLLAKTRPTDRQKDMNTRAQKRANVAGAFTVQDDIRGKRLLVLDDLYDSGETLKEVTRVLKRAGALSVTVLTLTRTRHRHL